MAGALGLLLVVATGGLEVYSRQPVVAPIPPLDLPANVSTLVLVVHGSADADNPQFPAIVARLSERYREVPAAAVRFVRWAPESDQRLRAAATAQSIGTSLGESLAKLGTVKELVLVAHSSGTFMPDAICTAFRAATPQPARITMTLLDPFQIHGFVDWTWGARQHGRCADFTLAVINTDDPAPATNRPLANAYNLDVTGHPGRAGFTRNGHYWPVQYYLDHLADQQPEISGWSFGDHPRGEVRVVSGH
jgi:hypothetical protein